MRTITLVEKNGQKKTVNINEGEPRPVYDELEAQGITLPHGCLSGVCGACRIEVVQGKELCGVAGAIESNTIESLQKEYANKYGENFLREKTVRLACRMKLQSEGAIEIKVLEK